MNASPLKSFFSLLAILPVLVWMSSFPSSTSATLSSPEFSTEDPDVCSADFRSFADLEKIKYKMYYNWNFVWVEAGEVTFQVTETSDEYYFKAVGKTKSSYEWFFKVYDVYESRVRKSDLKPVWSRRQVEEGKYRLYHEHWMDHEKGEARSIRGRDKSSAKEKKVPIEDCFQDILSMMYFLRNSGIHQYDPGKHLPVNLFIDDSVYQVRVKYMGGEQDKKIKGLGKMDVQRIIPDLVAGNVFTEQAKMNVWVSQDENRIPLMIESPILVGSVKAILNDYEHLLVPLNVKG